jgi:hypothetical protein
MDRFRGGLISGAAGTLALEAATYVDMMLRGRPASELPSAAAEKIADQVPIDLGSGDEAENRKSALGALLGYGTGLAVGLGLGLFAGRRRIPTLRGGIAVGLVAMAAADLPMVKLKLTDPSTWKRSDWIADIVSHVMYGVIATAVYNRQRVGSSRVRRAAHVV